MHFQNLEEHYHELLDFLETNHYSPSYIQKFKTVIKNILKDPKRKNWESYRGIYLEYAKSSHSEQYLRHMRTVIGALEQFDLFCKYPNGRRRHSLFGRGSYHLLNHEYQELIDFYCKTEKERGKKLTTIHSEAMNAASFLYAMQKKGFESLNAFTEESVLSFFLSDEGKLTKSCSYKKNIRAVFKAGISWKARECQKVLYFLPLLREIRKNIQYLTKEEVQKIRDTIDSSSSGLSKRDSAIVMLLLHTGIRGCDIAALKMNSINWTAEKIWIIQQKTEIPLELPLMPIVGNAIYDYVTTERPDSDHRFLFLSETRPFTPLASRSIGSIVTKILRIVGVRQNKGDRKGTHIFRHYLASFLLGNGIPQPIISRTLGHTSPDSLEPYLKADFVNLKECALSIEKFSVAEDVFAI
ncbi:tyrosine-type recombinase/integrase [Clostridium estertheticum]|uniref:tyrosine-type recombinase/integrase n=1 Tax=Clostridium estertheticum TaxID=238834 RepID=UPI001CF427B3|nr:tyrosine-type recombinase/integrase [Clostridium estertheticum]MCB2361044.1 tyrosine-type recombinase/integrase [Clostridium estertheticum]